MSRLRADRLLGFDTEWTCWEGDPPEGMESEIIEIGIVELDTRANEILREARYLVRPTRSTVSAYCTELTGLTQAEVRTGHPLGEVLRRMAKEFGTGSKPSLAWGNDWTGIDRECARIGQPNPIRLDGFLNLALFYQVLVGTSQRPSQEGAMEALGIEPSGTAHRAVDDARNALRVLQALRPGPSPEPEPEAGPAP